MLSAIIKWIEADRIDGLHYREVMREMVRGAYGGGEGGTAAVAIEAVGQDANPVHALERGEVDTAEFERELASRLRTEDGGRPRAEGLLSRMFAGFEPVEPMYAMLRTARANGLVTVLLSNSWGNDYPRERFAETFDHVVISGEVGMRKPEERIFRHTLDLAGLDPRECVFIDDIEANIAAAEALGMIGIHHTSPEATLAELERLTGLEFPRTA
ncbi:HAD family phosphatase [Bailinhaonella thermotolerans]|uniref:HAD family phosphatase n=2 Tax=Bailinhaonella thermotolerans TaxID=1070861 RepID=A0A3A4AWZ0_9ACTN|nr:HAD family phosphatase [Bailinhaonella thermotolerans]